MMYYLATQTKVLSFATFFLFQADIRLNTLKSWEHIWRMLFLLIFKKAEFHLNNYILS